MTTQERFRTFAEFYPFYLTEHSNQVSRRLHFMGSSIAAGLMIVAVVTRLWWLLAIAIVQGYGFAWIGHFFFERNRPATFKYPVFSLMGDWRMWWEILTGERRF